MKPVDVLTTEQVAESLGVPIRAVVLWTFGGRLARIKDRAGYAFRLQDLHHFMGRLTAADFRAARRGELS